MINDSLLIQLRENGFSLPLADSDVWPWVKRKDSESRLCDVATAQRIRDRMYQA